MATASVRVKKVTASDDDEVVAPVNLSKAKRPVRLTRAERAVRLKEKIFRAGAQIVGELGYQDASVARITQLAGIAQGTFYLYFETRQHLFDELLPHVGQDMMHYMGERLHGAVNYIDVEERGIRACFEYLRDNPGFYRLLNEAEFAAPIAHRRHMDQLVSHYTDSMKRSVDGGHLGNFEEDELRTLAYTAIAARSYIYLAYVKYGDDAFPPEKAIQTYIKLIGSGAG